MKRDEATVSYTMSRIRGKDTSIEVKLRKALYEKGCRYRCNSKYIFGHPDISFKGVKVVVFCDSEFWHGKDFEENEKKILSNREYWIPKIKRNIERDNEVIASRGKSFKGSEVVELANRAHEGLAKRQRGDVI